MQAGEKRGDPCAVLLAAITEIHGEFRTGKTQLAMTLCVTSQLPREMGGGNGKVAVVDTEGSFRAERLQAIADRFGVDRDTVLEQVVVARAFTVDQQQQALVNISAKMSEEPFRMLIVDSVMSILRTEYCGRGELSERQQRLGQMLGGMRKLAEEFNIAVVCTNQVMSDPAGGVFASADPKKPVGGHVLAHAVTNRLHVRKGKGQERIVKVSVIAEHQNLLLAVVLRRA
jgi:meiotic recombination protein DMC1